MKPHVPERYWERWTCENNNLSKQYWALFLQNFRAHGVLVFYFLVGLKVVRVWFGMICWLGMMFLFAALAQALTTTSLMSRDMTGRRHPCLNNIGGCLCTFQCLCCLRKGEEARVTPLGVRGGRWEAGAVVASVLVRFWVRMDPTPVCCHRAACISTNAPHPQHPNEGIALGRPTRQSTLRG